MKFFILGDSWGVGEWKWDRGIIKPVPDTGVDYYLTKQAHDVHNVAAGSASNFGQLRHTNSCLENFSDYDYIIWFHTEPIRDIIETIMGNEPDSGQQFPNFDITNFFACMKYLHYRNYQFAQQLYKTYKIPFVVVGCNGVVDDSIHDFDFARVVYKSWAAELLNYTDTIPLNWRLERLHLIMDHYGNKLDRTQLLSEISLMEKLDNAMKYQFPDGMHPSRQQYEKLSSFIINDINA